MLVAVTSYDGPAKQLIHALKFERARAAADPIARLMKQRMPPLSPGTIICPIPTAHRRVRQRGYDQSVLIARQLAGALELPCHSLLRRTSATRQVGKNRLQRGEQLYQAFQVVRSFPPTATILLVDDVVTTGSTIDAAAAVMHQAGSQHLAAAVFAMA